MKHPTITDVADAFDVPKLYPRLTESPIRFPDDRCRVTIVPWLADCDFKTRMEKGYLTNVIKATRTQPEYFRLWMLNKWIGLPLGGVITDDSQVHGLRACRHTVKVVTRRGGIGTRWLVEIFAPGGSVMALSGTSQAEAYEKAMDRAFRNVMKTLPHG